MFGRGAVSRMQIADTARKIATSVAGRKIELFIANNCFKLFRKFGLLISIYDTNSFYPNFFSNFAIFNRRLKKYYHNPRIKRINPAWVANKNEIKQKPVSKRSDKIKYGDTPGYQKRA